MNQLPCEVVRDLLPSYVDGLTAETTNEMVRAHLESCADCRARLDAMRAPESTSSMDVKEIDFLKKNRRKNRRVVLWSLLGALALAAGILLLRAFGIGSAASPESLACKAEVQDGKTLVLTGDVVDSAHVISGVRFRQEEDGTVYATVRTAMAGLHHSGRLDSTYTAAREITRVCVNGRVIWEDGVEISPLAARIFATRHDYVGDMSANMATAEAVGIRDILGPFTSSLDTAQRPYRWTLEFPVEDGQRAQAVAWHTRSWASNIGLVLLAAVDNLDEVVFHWEGDGYELQLTVDETHAATGLGSPDLDPKVCGRSAAGIQRLLDAVYWQRRADWDLYNDPADVIIGTSH
ncbi:MAG: DUF4825 domain-containing protein [Oscillospiraceae bacterium]|nr:DUF4825 domain-containing protein [Oscillospiraceae bacterium]